MLELEGLGLLGAAAEDLDAGFAALPPFSSADADADGIGAVLLEVAGRMRDNYPYPHPMYAGQMLKPPHPVARLSYCLALWLNPNNHALDGGRASSAMEKEAVAEIAGMFGWGSHLGHLCGGGTLANLEALWVAGLLHPGKKIVASQQAHYTHRRLAQVLHLTLETVPCDRDARMDLEALEGLLRAGEVGTVVATLGTTGAGSVDPLPALLDLQVKYGFRIHADAAYGGYFGLVDTLRQETKAAFASLAVVDSIAVDPHKHGLQPYGCGCILFRDPSVGRFYAHDAPYTYFSSPELHLGEISLECSRAGASAVALWATQRLLPLVPGGAFAARLARSHEAALRLSAKIASDPLWRLAFAPELDIVVWAPRAASASAMSDLSRRIFAAAARRDLHLAVATFPAALLQQGWPEVDWDQDQVACLRSCLLKPEHLDWVEPIWESLSHAAAEVLGADTVTDVGRLA